MVPCLPVGLSLLCHDHDIHVHACEGSTGAEYAQRAICSDSPPSSTDPWYCLRQKEFCRYLGLPAALIIAWSKGYAIPGRLSVITLSAHCPGTQGTTVANTALFGTPMTLVMPAVVAQHGLTLDRSGRGH